MHTILLYEGPLFCTRKTPRHINHESFPPIQRAVCGPLTWTPVSAEWNSGTGQTGPPCTHFDRNAVSRRLTSCHYKVVSQRLEKSLQSTHHRTPQFLNKQSNALREAWQRHDCETLATHPERYSESKYDLDRVLWCRNKIRINSPFRLC